MVQQQAVEHTRENSRSPAPDTGETPPEAEVSNSARRRALHETIREERAARFARGILGQVTRVRLPPVPGFVADPPVYRQAARAASQVVSQRRDGVDRKLDLRCFFTGVACDPNPTRDGTNRDPRLQPWLGTRDHLVPLRRGVAGAPPELAIAAQTSIVWASNVANITLGLAPLLVRLTIRRWLMTIPFDRNDTSVEGGTQVRWIMIELLDHFRMRPFGEWYPWSRVEGTDSWWDASIQAPFMRRMWQEEARFLALEPGQRESYIEALRWQF